MGVLGSRNPENTQQTLMNFTAFLNTVIILGCGVFSLFSHVAALQSKWQTGIQFDGRWFTLISCQLVESQSVIRGFLRINPPPSFSLLFTAFRVCIKARSFNQKEIRYWCLDRKPIFLRWIYKMISDWKQKKKLNCKEPSNTKKKCQFSDSGMEGAVEIRYFHCVAVWVLSEWLF